MKGFTLLEMMVSVAATGIIAVAATALFFSAIRGGGKVEVATGVKQSGQISLSIMEQLIRNTQGVVECTGLPVSSIVFNVRGGERQTFTCEDIGTDQGRISSASASLTSSLTPDRVTVTACSFTCSEDVNGFRGPLITIDFSLKQKGSGVSVVDTARGDFSTSVYLRNF